MGLAFLSLGILIIAVFWIRTRIARGERGRYDKLEQFVSDEMASNNVRKTPIAENYFIKADIKKLPVEEYDAGDSHAKKLAYLQAAALQNANQDMIKFNAPMSNRDIKMMFGTANLETVTMYEENHNRFIMALYDWALALTHAGRVAQARQILAYAVKIKADYMKVFLLLATLYKQDNDKEAISRLVAFVSQAAYLITKEKILIELQAMLAAMAEMEETP